MSHSRVLRLAAVYVFVLTSLLLGCSIHPLPGDIPRVATIDIVERMRCEAREGLKHFNPDDTLIKKILDGTTIGYDFVFHVTEGNNEGTAAAPGSVTFQRPGRNESLVSLNLTASSEKLRSNIRRFRIIEELKTLYDADCSKPKAWENLIFPITGATGMAEVVRTFIKLEQLVDLQDGAGPDRLNSLNSDRVVFSDVLKFTTTLTAGATPTVHLSAPVGSFRLTEASITGTAVRTDDHDVIVAIARHQIHVDRAQVVIQRAGISAAPNEDGQGGSSRERFSSKTTVATKASVQTTVAAARRKELIKTGAVRDSRTVTALVQKDAVAYNRVLIELQRLRNLEDDAREAPRLLGERLLEIMRTP